MKTPKGLILLLAPVLLAVQIGLSLSDEIPVVNVHESVQSVAEVVKLQNVMAGLGLTHTVLHAIPDDLIDFAGEEAELPNLSEVDENNRALQQVIAAYPEQFSYFCSIDPANPDRLTLLSDCLNSGALGVKLYNGYSYAHALAIDDSRLNEFYSVLASGGALLMLPVNTTNYESELRNLLTLNPELEVICSHFCLSSKALGRLTALMNEFPNLYIDTSFGSIDFVKDGFKTISENREDFQAFFDVYQDRILFGTDIVLTSYEDESLDWLTGLYADYLALLREGEFESSVLGLTVQGLDLPESILRKVFYKNWMALLTAR